MKKMSLFPVRTHVNLSEQELVYSNKLVADSMISDCDCDCVSDCACSPVDEPEYEFRLPFKNHEQALHSIKNNRFRYVLLDAPAGYGKTFLLHESRLYLSTQGYRCLLVDFKYNQNKLKTVDEIRREISIGFDIDIDNAPDPVAAFYGGIRQISKFVLMFDSIDINDDGHLVHWLYETLAKPLEHDGHKEFKIIFSGRHVQRYKNKYKWENWIGLRKEVLHAIRIKHIDEILEMEKSAVGGELRYRTAEGMAWLSAGHPGIIESLVKEWIKNNCGQDFTPTTKKEKLKDIFIRRINDHVAKLLIDLDEKEIRLLRIISIFRQMDSRLLKELFDKNILDGDYQVAWSKITGRNLFIKPRSYTYWHDGVMRQVMARKLEILENPVYCDFHKVALEVWSERLYKLSEVSETVGNEQIINALHNVLYHTINSGLSKEEAIESISQNLLKVQKNLHATIYDLVALFDNANFNEIDLHEDRDWLEYLEIRYKPWPSTAEVRSHLEQEGLSKKTEIIIAPTDFKASSSLPDSVVSVINIENNIQKIVGTGFLTRYSGKNLIITCTHVLRALQKKIGEPVSLKSKDGEIIYEATILTSLVEEKDVLELTAEEDIAVLSLNGTPNTIWQWKLGDLISGSECDIFGYGETRGKIGKIVTLEIKGKVGEGYWQLNRIIGNPRVGMEKGMSGAPILSHENANIVGIFSGVSLNKGYPTCGDFIPANLVEEKIRKIIS